MKKLMLIIPVVFLFISLRAAATEGCLVPGYADLLVTEGHAGETYSNKDSIWPDPGCRWVLVTFMTGCAGHGTGGVKGEYIQECPLDDYVAGLFIFTSVISIFYLGRKQQP